MILLTYSHEHLLIFSPLPSAVLDLSLWLFNVKYWWLKRGSLSAQGLCCLLSACTLAEVPESMGILCNYIQKQLNPNTWCLLSFSVERKKQREELNFKSPNQRVSKAGVLITLPFLGSFSSRQNSVSSELINGKWPVLPSTLLLL